MLVCVILYWPQSTFLSPSRPLSFVQHIYLGLGIQQWLNKSKTNIPTIISLLLHWGIIFRIKSLNSLSLMDKCNCLDKIRIVVYLLCKIRNCLTCLHCLPKNKTVIQTKPHSLWDIPVSVMFSIWQDEDSSSSDHLGCDKLWQNQTQISYIMFGYFWISKEWCYLIWLALTI